MNTAADRFLNQNGGTSFERCSYRPGANFVGEFALTNRYRFNERHEMEWGWPGWHDGEDQYVEEGEGPDIVVCPFDFARSGYKDWKGRMWGSDVYLYHRLGFRWRISHMYPDQINVLDRLTSGYPIHKGVPIGKTGSYGDSTGLHTHTEIEAWDFAGGWLSTCKTLDYILIMKYGDEADEPYTSKERWTIYEGCKHSKDLEAATIDDDYTRLLTARNDGRKVIFANKYKVRLKDGYNRVTTLYSSRFLFGGI